MAGEAMEGIAGWDSIMVNSRDGEPSNKLFLYTFSTEADWHGINL